MRLTEQEMALVGRAGPFNCRVVVNW